MKLTAGACLLFTKIATPLKVCPLKNPYEIVSIIAEDEKHSILNKIMLNFTISLGVNIFSCTKTISPYCYINVVDISCFE